MEENNFKVCILAAGKGERLQNTIGYLHKALVSVGGKPVINHIIDKISPNTEVVIAVGYEKELLKEYLTIAYPARKFTFIEVDILTGKFSGPGYSLLCCKNELQCPFILTTCDTIVDSYPTFVDTINWVGVSKSTKPEMYCTIESDENGQVSKIFEKSKRGTNNAYIGVMGISDYQEFWNSLSNNLESKAGEIQVSNAWTGLLQENKDLIISNFKTWYDTGNIQDLEKTRQALGGTNNLEKEGESLYFIQNGEEKEVVKFFKDPDIILGRIRRSQVLSKKNIVPTIKRYSDHFYVYDFIDGNIMSDVVDDSLFKEFLKWCSDTIWTEVPMTSSGIALKAFKNQCQKVHEIKTKERIQKWLDMGIVTDNNEIINGYQVPKIDELLSLIDWRVFKDGIPVYWHGDLHFENVIVTPNKEFKCIDWRQDFAGQQNCGDMYYDLAKLYHGLLVSHKSVYKNLFHVKKDKDGTNIDIMMPMNNVSCIKILKDFVLSRNLDFRKVKILTYFVYLNIACLHHSNYNEFLWYLGKLGLYKTLNGIE